jgi:transcriptional regulator with XRE-family HTH domain
VETENGSPPDPGQIPVVHKTVNQIVARNITRLRKAAGLTQEELGRLTGRSKRNISADERSWDGERTREFSAQDITDLAVALGVPIGAFFLPPGDDGTAAQYLFRSGSGRQMDMAALMAALMPDSDEDTPAMEAYRNRLTAAVGQYLDPSWASEAARWRKDLAGPEIRAERAEWLRMQRAAALGLAAALGELADAISDPEDAP